MEFRKIYVVPDGTDQKKDNTYTTITEALNSIPPDNQKPVTISVAPGIYREKITIDRSYVTLEGSGAGSEDVIFSFHDYANDRMEDGSKRGTFRSYSVLVDAHDVTLRNLTIENASGDSLTHGQAIALYADGDRLILDSCCLLGHQDTLFTGPLPPKEVIKDGFIGPKQFAPRVCGRHYYKDCYICGDIDFIFGGATAFFENCTIESLRHFPETAGGSEDRAEKQIHGYVTAASTPEGEAYGYVFENCRLVSEECPAGSVYLGRPWREYAKTVFIDCVFGEHIHPQLFHDWNKEKVGETIYYAVSGEENGNLFPQRAGFVREIAREQAAAFTKERVLAGKDGWNPLCTKS